jgi:hypothetical protein
MLSCVLFKKAIRLARNQNIRAENRNFNLRNLFHGEQFQVRKIFHASERVARIQHFFNYWRVNLAHVVSRLLRVTPFLAVLVFEHCVQLKFLRKNVRAFDSEPVHASRKFFLFNAVSVFVGLLVIRARTHFKEKRVRVVNVAVVRQFYFRDVHSVPVVFHAN